MPWNRGSHPHALSRSAAGERAQEPDVCIFPWYPTTGYPVKRRPLFFSPLPTSRFAADSAAASAHLPRTFLDRSSEVSSALRAALAAIGVAWKPMKSFTPSPDAL